MSEQAIEKLLLFWWTHYSKVTYTQKEKDAFECFVKSDAEKMLQMAIEAHNFGFETTHIIQDIREKPICFRFLLTDYPESNPSNPDYENIKADFLRELAEKYIETYVNDRLRTSGRLAANADFAQTLKEDARASLGLPRKDSQEIEIETLLHYWWTHYNQTTMSEEENKMFHALVMQDKDKALQLAVQESIFGMNPRGVLIIIKQNILDEMIAALPKVENDDPDYARLRQAFIEQVTADYLDVEMGTTVEMPPPNWFAYANSLAASLNLVRIRKEQEKNGN